MLLEIQLRAGTADCRAAAAQVLGGLNRLLADGPRLGDPFAEVLIFAMLKNPFGLKSPPWAKAPTAEGQTLFCSTILDYSDWVAPNWKGRVLSVVKGAASAIREATPNHLSVEIADDLIALVERSGAALSGQPPDQIELLGPVYVTLDSDGRFLGAGTNSPAHETFGSWRFVTVPPEDVIDAAKRYQR